MKKEEHFNQIVAENSERIKRICAYYSSDTHDAKDIFQEVLINIWKSLDSFKGDSAISTWIYRIAVNTTLSYIGNAYKYMKLMVRADTQNLCVLFDEESSETNQLMEERFECLQNELNMLSVIDKALISLMLEGISMKEIADIIGITETNVKVKIHRIKEQLKTKLTGDSYENK